MINSLPTNRHDDERRTLIEWIQDFPVRSCKVVVAKGECLVGNHYHKNKDEIFYLLKGSGEVELDGLWETLNIGDVIYIPAGMRHSFELTDGSILLGASTKPYDKDDEHKD